MSFGSLFMLGWGVVIAVPVILHLLRKRKSRTVSWGAMRFLQTAMVRRAKRFQLWRLLLLATRILAIIMLAFAVARPLLKDNAGNTNQFREGPRRLNILVFDSSYSMRALGQGGGGNGQGNANRTRFEIAKQAAQDVLRGSQSGDGFLLMKLGSKAEWIGAGISYRTAEIAEVIDQLEPGEDVAHFGDGMLALARMLEDIKQEGWPGPIRICMFSDLQPISWEGAKGANIEAVAERIARTYPESKAEILVVDCRHQSGVNNAWVGKLDVRRSGTGEGMTIEVRTGVSPIEQRSEQSDQIALAQLLINGRVEQSQRVQLNETGRVLDWNKRLGAGRHAIEVRLATDDAIEIDNTVRQVVTVQDRIPIALFADSPSGSRYVELALTASLGAGSSGSASDREATGSGDGFGYQLQRYRFNEMSNVELGRELVWVLCDPVPLEPRDAERLQQHIKQGGGVVWWLGPNWQLQAGSLSLELSDADDAEQFWSATRVVVGGEGDRSLSIDPLGYRDPIVRPFEPYPGAGLLTLPVFRYWQVSLGAQWNVALGISGKVIDDAVDPLIARLERRQGGREVIITTPPNAGVAGAAGDLSGSQEPWNALIAWPAFVPLVQEILQWTAASQEVPGAFVIGEPIMGNSRETELGTRVEGSSGEQLSVEVLERMGSRVKWSAGQAERADVYRWMDGARQGEAVFAVNVDTAEGLLRGEASIGKPLRLIRADEIENAMERSAGQMNASGGDNFIASDDPGQDLGGDTDSATTSPTNDQGWWLLLVAIVVLLGESALVRVLENRF